jgi:diguanylate cyclase (GGDEF)-like protein
MLPIQAAGPGRHPLRAALLLLALAMSPLPPQPSAAAADSDPQAELARRLTASGEVDEAREHWQAIATRAGADGNIRKLNAARDALAELDFLQGRYDDFRQSQQQRLAEARARGDLDGMASALMQLGVLERRLGRLAQARPLFERALLLRRQLDDPDGEALVLTQLGLVLLNQGDLSGTLDALGRSLELQQAGARAKLDRTYHYLGLLYRSLQEFDQARDFLLQGLAEAERLDDPMRKAAVLGSLARVSNDSGRHADALEYTARAHDINRRFESLPGLAYDALERGRAQLGLGRLQDARETLEACVALAAALNQNRTQADARFSLGRLALLEGRSEDAVALIEQALPVYAGADDAPQTLEAYRLLIPLLRERGELERALELSETSLRLQDQVSGLRTNRRLALAEYRQRSAESQRQIEILTRDNEIQTLQLRQETLNRNFGIAAVLGLLLVLASLLWRYRQSRRLATSLEQSRTSLAEAHAALEARAQALYRASTTDALTGVANRGHVLARLPELLAEIRGTRRPLGLLLFDIDHFKQVNDRHGHLTGDAVLVRTARAVEALLPGNALFGRFGGEEFILVLPGTATEAALEFAERLRQAVAGAGGGGPVVTLSVGVACTADAPDADMETLIEAADRALYEAKTAGRNRVMLARRAASARLH